MPPAAVHQFDCALPERTVTSLPLASSAVLIPGAASKLPRPFGHVVAIQAATTRPRSRLRSRKRPDKAASSDSSACKTEAPRQRLRELCSEAGNVRIASKTCPWTYTICSMPEVASPTAHRISHYDASPRELPFGMRVGCGCWLLW